MRLAGIRLPANGWLVVGSRRARVSAEKFPARWAVEGTMRCTSEGTRRSSVPWYEKKKKVLSLP